MAPRAAASKVAVFGVPSAAGATGPGTERAAFALREAGLLEALRADGTRVVNLSDLSLFPWQDDAGHPHARNVELAACAARATADEMTRALAEGFTVVLGGDGSLVAGALAGARAALGRDVGLVHLDANADLNTPETSPSGRLAGMALALALGRGPVALTTAGGPAPAVLGKHVALLGYRALDAGEGPALAELGLAASAVAVRAHGGARSASEALGAIGNAGGPVVVHLDVDLLEPACMPAKAGLTPGPGLDWAEAEALLVALCGSPRVVALEVCEFNPTLDAGGDGARSLVALIAAAVRARVGP
jgi:arginase